jgi:prepilin-type N-terminal cleavage/methylation domain-containing protein/prepilin-type processing-associated H-X9-DG protein
MCIARGLFDTMSRKKGFTLIELVAVVGIVGVLVGLLVPAIQHVREAARRVDCENRVRQLGLGCMDHESARRSFPAGITSAGVRPYPSRSWLQAILPFVEQQSLHDQAVSDYGSSPFPFAGHVGMQTVVDLYQCPSELDAGELHWTHENRLVASTSYLGVNGTDWEKRDGVFFLDSAIRFADIGDGTSNTLMIGERPASPDFWYGWWYAGFGQQGTGSCDMLLGVRERKAPPLPGVTTYLEDCPDGPYQFEAGKHGRQCDTLHFWSYHPGGAVFALCDGSVRLISYDANEIMPALATRDGGETVVVPE